MVLLVLLSATAQGSSNCRSVCGREQPILSTDALCRIEHACQTNHKVVVTWIKRLTMRFTHGHQI